MYTEEDKLLKAAEGYNNTANIEQQLLNEAMSDGLSEPEAQQVVKRVLERLGKTETGRKGGAFGVAHNPNNQFATLSKLIKQLHSY